MIKPIKVLNYGNKFHWGTIGMFVSVLSLSSLGLMTNHQWQDLQKKERFLNTSVVSRSSANYGVSEPANPVVQVDLNIIGDMIRDSQPEASDLAARLASVDELLHSPIPGDTLLSNLTGSEPGTNPPVTYNPIDLPTALAPAAGPVAQSTPGPTLKAPNNPDPQNTKVPKLDKPKETKDNKDDKDNKPKKD